MFQTSFRVGQFRLSVFKPCGAWPIAELSVVLFCYSTSLFPPAPSNTELVKQQTVSNRGASRGRNPLVKTVKKGF